MKTRIGSLGILFFGLSVACTNTTAQKPVLGPSPSATSTVRGTEPSQPPKAEGPAAAPSIIASAPASCSEYRLERNATCAIAADTKVQNRTLDAVDAALSVTDPIERNRRLSSLDGCAEFEPGFIVALRADLAPPECGDSIVEPWTSDPNASLSLEFSQLLRAIAIGAQLLRAESAPPSPTPPFTRDVFESFLKDRIRPWYQAQSRTIYNLAAEGARLSGYGKAITAIEAGLSDLRFVDNVRKVPLPDEMAKDAELVEVYEQSLEDALEPRKARGRDAILVGLLHLGQQGVLNHPRLSRARAVLSQLFAGSRVDALEELLLPSLPKLSQATVIERLAAKLPPFFAERLLTEPQIETPEVLRALLERGLAPKFRQYIERKSYESAPIAQLYSHALLRLGSVYFRPSDFTRATIILSTKGARLGPAAREAHLISAIANALQGGPENTVELMLSGPMLPDSMGKVEELEKLAKGNDAVAGYAAYNAAYLLTIIPKKTPDPKHWEKASRLFDDAARKLPNDELKQRAKSRADEARATAQHLLQRNATDAGA